MRFLTIATILIQVFTGSNSLYAAPVNSNQHFQMSILTDSSNTMSVEAVKERYLNRCEQFIPYTKKHNMSFKSGISYWIHLKPLSTDSLTEYVLSFRRWVSTIEVYPYPFTQVSSRGGRMVPYNQKELPDCSVYLKQNSNGYLIKVKNEMGTFVSNKNIQIMPALSFQKWKKKGDFLQGFIQGLFWLMLFYNLLLYIVVKKRMYLYYVIYTLFNSLYFLFLFGFSEVYFFPNSYKLNLILYTFQIIGVFPYLMFLRSMLFNHCPAYTHKADRKIYRPYLCILLAVNLLIASTVLVWIDFYNIAFNVSNMVNVFIGMCIIAYYYKKSDSIMGIIFKGSAIMVIFGIIDILYVPLNLPVDNLFFETGVVLELVFFAYAISKQQSQDVIELFQIEQKKQQLEGELDNKNRELVYQAIKLSAKEEILFSVKENIKNLDLPNKEKVLVLSNIELSNSMNNNLWKEFELHFNETNPDFYKALIDKYPTLTSNEMRLCAFLRLNLNTKEIAALTQKSVHSIEMMRSRIRQKMQLDRDANFFLILTQL
jgi:hypothetical protein